MAMSESLNGLSLSSLTSVSSSPDHGVSLSADDDEDDAIENFGNYAGKVCNMIIFTVLSDTSHYS